MSITGITSNREELRKIEYVVARKTGDLAVLKTVFPKHVQIGISDDEFRSSLTVEGTGTFLTAISGSLQTLADGTNYLRGGSNISVVNNLDGSITISAGSGFSGNTTNALTHYSKIHLLHKIPFLPLVLLFWISLLEN